MDKLPKKWCVMGTPCKTVQKFFLTYKDNTIKDFVSHSSYDKYYFFSEKYSGYSHDFYASHKIEPGYTEISFEDFKRLVLKEMNTQEKIKQLEVELNKLKEEVKKETEFKVGDYIIFSNLSGDYAKSNGDIVKITSIRPDTYHTLWIGHTPRSFSGGGFSYNAYKNKIRRATKEEIAKATNKSKELYFGDTKVTIKQGSSYAETQYGNISKVEIKEIIDFFNQDITLLGRKMSIENTSTWYIKFGCRKGTYQEIKEIYKAFD